MTHRIVYAGHNGPGFHEFRTQGDLVATLMAWRMCGSVDPTATLWKRTSGAWVPAFPWQHGRRV